MSLVIVTSVRFADHLTPPGHPERRERAEAMQVVTSRWAQHGGTVLEPRAATDEELARVHRPEYIEELKRTRGRAVLLDPDTFTSPESEEVARMAAGAVLTAIEHVLEPALEEQAPRETRDTGSQEPTSRSGANGVRRALALVRPPGHHAEAARAMGFCLYNNVAVAAAAARARGIARVAIVDYDVHHGNGTQWMFYDDPSVLFVSSHQYPFYPGTGAAGETGRGAGVGYTVNLPLDAGATDADYDLLYRDVVVPVLEQFRPELLLVSAGFDAHADDPLGGMRLSTEGYAQLTARLIAAADELCGGRIVFVTEGGYDTAALAACCQRVVALGSAPSVKPPEAIAGPTPRGDDTLAAFRRAHRR